MTFSTIGNVEDAADDTDKSTRSLVCLSNDERLIVIYDKYKTSLHWCDLPNGLSDIFDPEFSLESKLLNQTLPLPSADYDN